MLELLQKYPEATKAVKSYYLEIMLNSLNDASLPEDFKDHVRAQGIDDDKINLINQKLNHKLNDSGKLYLTHTLLKNKYTLRMVTAQTNVTQDHVNKAWNFILRTARSLNY